MGSTSVGVNSANDDALRVAWLNAAVTFYCVACFMTLNKLCDCGFFFFNKKHPCTRETLRDRRNLRKVRI
jgi:hypothetical protein